MLKIGYFADGPWAHRAFEKLIEDNTIEIKFICVRYDKKDAVLMEYAKKYHIPLEMHANINSIEFLEKVKGYNADLLVSMSFNQIFKRMIMDIPPMKIINCHAGKLPFYRGRNILNWALINDEKEFGITVHYVDEGIDTGDIILQRVYPITDYDDYGTLLEKAYEGCANILYDAVKLLQKDVVTPISQNSIDPIGTYFGMRMQGDEIVDWNQNSRDVFNFIRAIAFPGPKATSYIAGKIVKINTAKLVEGAHVYKNTVGQVVGKKDGSFFVKTKDTMLEIIDFEYEGSIKVGDRLVNHA